jgi:transcriptional/translational regulatory protein YebC/TACO1
MMLALELGADDVDSSSDEYITIVCPPAGLESVKEGLKKAGMAPDSAETVLSPISSVEVQDKEMARQLLKLLDTLENHDDVQHVYANFEMDSEWMAELYN